MADEEMMNAEVAFKRRPKKGGKIGWLIVIVLLIVAGAVGWKYFGKNGGGTDQAAAAAGTQDPSAAAAVAKEVQDLSAAVGKLIALPQEDPTVATIMDAPKLIAEQAFYSGAVNGDKLLIFPKAQKAIIYSPSRNQLVNVGPVYFNNGQPTAGTKPAAKPTDTKTKATSTN